MVVVTVVVAVELERAHARHAHLVGGQRAAHVVASRVALAVIRVIAIVVAKVVVTEQVEIGVDARLDHARTLQAHCVVFVVVVDGGGGGGSRRRRRSAAQRLAHCGRESEGAADATAAARLAASLRDARAVRVGRVDNVLVKSGVYLDGGLGRGA